MKNPIYHTVYNYFYTVTIDNKKRIAMFKIKQTKLEN